MSAPNEFTRGWQILFLAFVGVATSAAVLPLYGFGALMGPLEAAFGWSRSDLMATTSFSSFGNIFAVQAAGWLNTRYGVRRVSIVSFFTLCGLLLLMTQMQRLGGSIWLFYGFYAVMGFAGVGTLQVTWTQLVNGWFDKNRGLALAIILSGSGAIGMFLPWLLTSTMEHYDWRAGFVVLAVLPLIITLPLALMWLREVPTASSDGKKIKVTGVTYAEGKRDWRFWVMTSSIIMIAAAIMVVLANGVAIIMDQGYSASEASKMFGMFGLSLVIGRIIVGILVDRIWAPAVACVVFLMCALGCFLLAIDGPSTTMIIVAIALVGIGAGAEFDLAAFLVARYFGLRDYPRLFGLQMAALSAGICAAPASVAFGYGLTGSYRETLIFYGCLVVVSAFLILALGRYPTLESE